MTSNRSQPAIIFNYDTSPPYAMIDSRIFCTLLKDDVIVAGLSTGHLALWHPLTKALVDVGSAVYSLAVMNEKIACGCDKFVAFYEWRDLLEALEGATPAMTKLELPRVQLATGAALPIAEANALAWDGSKLWIGAGDGKVYAFEEDRLTASSITHRDMVLALDWRTNLITSASEDGTVQQMDPRSGKVQSYNVGPDAYCTALNVDDTWITVAGGIEKREQSFAAKDGGFLNTYHASSGKKSSTISLDSPCRDLAYHSSLFLATDLGVLSYDLHAVQGPPRPLDFSTPSTSSPATISILDPLPPRWANRMMPPTKAAAAAEGGKKRPRDDDDDLMALDDTDENRRPSLLIGGSPPVVNLWGPPRGRTHLELAL